MTSTSSGSGPLLSSADSPTSITTSAPTTSKPSLTSTTGAGSTSKISSGILNALTGAAIGAGTSALINRVTAPKISKPAGAAKTVVSKAVDDLIGKGVAKATSVIKGVLSPTNQRPAPVINPATGNPSGTGYGDDPEEYSTDSLGNIFKTMEDGTAELYRAPEVTETDEFFEDSLGNVYRTTSDGTYELYRDAALEEDPNYYGYDYYDSEADPNNYGYDYDDAGNSALYDDPYSDAYYDDSYYYDDPNNYGYDYDSYYDDPNNYGYDYDSYYDDSASFDDPYADAYYDDSYYYDDPNNYGYDYDSYYYDDPYLYEDLQYEKRGGLITMMKKGGGISRFAGGGESKLTALDDPYADAYYDDSNYYPELFNASAQVVVYGPDGTAYGSPGLAESAGVYDYSMTNPNNYGYDYYDAESDPNNYGYDYYDAEADPNNYGYDYDNEITSPGGGDFFTAKNIGNILTDGYEYVKGIGSDALSGITTALGTPVGAAGAGALVATLLGQDFGGGTGQQNKGLDMSKVGLINPRTTNFGVGPSNFVGYDQYSTDAGGYEPNYELLKNLNSVGYNPVNEGDYDIQADASQEEEVEMPQMASGGLSSMATPVASYYTFGQPADILANLGMRPQPPMNSPDMMAQTGQPQQGQPQQAQQQGLPQQMPPQMGQQMGQQMPQGMQQGMPQQGAMPQQPGMPPAMRKGGLPRASNVPMVQGRMDFRQGAAVHGEGDGQSDDIPAMLADGEYVIDSETVAQIGNGSTKAGAQALDKFRESIRAHKRSAPINKIPPKTKVLTSYLKGAK